MGISFEPIKPHIGARAHIGDRAALFTAAGAAACRDALERHTVVVFPELGLDDAEQLRFTDLIGERVSFHREAPGAFKDDIYRVSLDAPMNGAKEYVLATFFWHMDGITVDRPPAKASLLSARRVAARAGQTGFASTYAAYATLPEIEKAELAGVRVRHTTWAGMRHFQDAIPEAERETIRAMGLREQEHPIVWTRADGRKSLVIGSTADSIVGESVPAGRARLQRLLEWAVQPDFTYTHDWREGDFVMWDNTGALHRVTPYEAASGRLMHRTSIAGAESVA